MAIGEVELIHRGKAKTLAAQQKTLLRGQQAIEPAIGQTKTDGRLVRNWLKASESDAGSMPCCAALDTTCCWSWRACRSFSWP